MSAIGIPLIHNVDSKLFFEHLAYSSSDCRFHTTSARLQFVHDGSNALSRYTSDDEDSVHDSDRCR